MKVIKSEYKYIKKINNKKSTIILGNFDGLHLGHRILIEKAKKKSMESNTELTVVTFSKELTKHKYNNDDTFLTSEKERIDIFNKLGVDNLYILKFDESLKEMTPNLFVTSILIEKLNVENIYVGEKFKFGKRAAGNVRSLEELSKQKKFNVYIQKDIKKNNKVISSSLIREYIKSGEVAEANKLLGRKYNIFGKVVQGKGRGKLLGFATANIETIKGYALPKEGVYETTTEYGGKEYKSLTNIGNNPTFGDVSYSIETHIIGFKNDIYGEDIQIKFKDRIREEIKFKNIDELISTVKKDIENIKKSK